MNVHLGFESQFRWLLSHSLEASVLVVLVLLVQRVFRRQLTHRWHFALWWIVLARLLLPFNPGSPMSLFNVFQPAIRLAGSSYPLQPGAPVAGDLAAGSLAVGRRVLWRVNDNSRTPPGIGTGDAPVQGQRTPSASGPTSNDTSIRPTSPGMDGLLIPGLAGFWLAGVLALSGVVATQLTRFNRKLARTCAPADPSLQTLLESCQREFGVSEPIELLETDAVQSPALFGLLRLRLLLPRGIGGQFTEPELRYMFLHELAHVKRGDLWLNWLITGLQVAHWFNPILWLGFARLRSDRELACDELALLRSGDDAGRAYGETAVKLLQNLNRPAAIPGLIGILEDKKQMRRRISMIAAFRKSGRWSALAVLLIAAVAVAALTAPRSDASRRTALPAESGLEIFAIRHGSHNQPVFTNQMYLSYPPDWPVSGRVLDAETRQPVPRFRGWSTEGGTFNHHCHFEGTNGAYLTHIKQYLGPQVITVQADGYLLERRQLVVNGPTNLDFVLKKGSRVAGTVVMPDGRPAVGATVVLLGEDHNRVGLTASSQLTSVGNKSIFCTTDRDGKFESASIGEMKLLLAASADGIAGLSLRSLETNSTVRLEPFGRITGRWSRAAGPATGEQLNLTFSGGEESALEAIDLLQLATTDSQGNFGFDRVPAGRLQLSRFELVSDCQIWRNDALQEVVVRPGETLDVNIAAEDHFGTAVVIPYQVGADSRAAATKADALPILP